MQLNNSALQLLGLTAVVAVLIAILAFAVLRFASAARETRKNRSNRDETAFLAAALQEAVMKLKAQERATAARADASERLSDEIVSSLTAGLMVAGLDGNVRILNPAGRRMLNLAADASPEACRQALAGVTLSGLIDECLETSVGVVRRSIVLPEPQHGVSHLGVSVSPLFDDRRSLHGVICLFTDLSAVKQLEDQLRLKESLAAVGELTAGCEAFLEAQLVLELFHRAEIREQTDDAVQRAAIVEERRDRHAQMRHAVARFGEHRTGTPHDGHTRFAALVDETLSVTPASAWRHASGEASAARFSMRRPAGFRIRTFPSSPATIRPAVRLETISSLRRSDASARAAVARSCAFSFMTAS